MGVKQQPKQCKVKSGKCRKIVISYWVELRAFPVARIPRVLSLSYHLLHVARRCLACWFMLHINVFNVFIARPTQKTKTHPTPPLQQPRQHGCVCRVSCNPLNVISSQWQSQQDRSPLTSTLPTSPHTHTVYAHFSWVVVAENFWASPAQLQLQLEGLVFLALFSAPLWQFQL